MSRIEEDDSLDPQVTIRGFAGPVTMAAPKLAFLREDSAWRMAQIYRPTMVSRVLLPLGLALDIGAGFGSFALPFAKAYAGWQVLAFEPEPQCFDSLKANAALAPGNLIALPVAVGAPDQRPENPQAVRDALAEVLRQSPGSIDHLLTLLPRHGFRRHKRVHVYLTPGDQADEDYDVVTYPVLASDLLAELQPSLLKLTAPQGETGILSGLREAPLDDIFGEVWSHLRSDLVHQAQGQRHTWLAKAGVPLLALRRGPESRRAGLDVVVALYNTAAFVCDCVAGILNGQSAEVRVIVVDDGSTDGSGDLVAERFAHDARVRVVRKPNGGCASARNFGRMHSDASHIAFVDADDLPGENLFGGLLELARHTGCEIVQGGYHLVTAEGAVKASVESEEPMVIEAQRHDFDRGTCHLLPSAWLMAGQPTIWRRVYRRDFLDNKQIWFPEHIRAFDDQLFQILTLQAVENVAVLDGVSYGYRQHPGQDIKQFDERNFYSLEMFRLAVERGLADGWHDFTPLMRSFVNTVNWNLPQLRADLRAAFVRGAAEFWVVAGKALGTSVIQRVPAQDVQAPDFAAVVAEFSARLADIPPGAAWAHLDSPLWHVGLMRKPWA